MAINPRDPAYQEYIAECKKLSKRYFEEEDAILAKYPLEKGLDHPAGHELREISLRHNAELKTLQRKYSFLFGSKEET